MMNKRSENTKFRLPDMQEKASDTDAKQLKGLANLVLIQARFRQAKTLKELAFIAVNDTRLLFQYQQAVCVLRGLDKKGDRKLVAISDVTEVDSNTPYAQWVLQIAKKMDDSNSGFIENQGMRHCSVRQMKSTLSNDLIAGWQRHAPDYLLWIPTKFDDDTLGGILLFRKQAWKESELRVLDHLRDAYNYSVVSLLSRPWLTNLSKIYRNKKNAMLVIASFVLLVACLPVSLTILAPAQVIPQDPFMVRSPLNGSIELVHVKPNTIIEFGSLLVSLDKSELTTRLEIAKQSRVIVEAELRQAQQSAFTNLDAKSLLPILKLKLEKNELEVAYTEGLLARSDIRSEKTGLVLYGNHSSLIGRPVQLGERLMSVADPAQVQLEIYLPAGDDIELVPGDRVRLFLSAAPETPIDANLTKLSYEAEEHQNGLAYFLTAEFSKSVALPRIGQRGTARIQGQQVSLFYYLFRRPMAFLRQRFGW